MYKIFLVAFHQKKNFFKCKKAKNEKEKIEREPKRKENK